jgi:hypothetical protein
MSLFCNDQELTFLEKNYQETTNFLSFMKMKQYFYIYLFIFVNFLQFIKVRHFLNLLLWQLNVCLPYCLINSVLIRRNGI